jgi:hypothetical protein
MISLPVLILWFSFANFRPFPLICPRSLGPVAPTPSNSPAQPIDARYRLDNNKVLAGVGLGAHCSGMENVRRKQRDEFDHPRQAAPSEAGSLRDGEEGRLAPDDLSRFEGEGGLAVSELWAHPIRKSQFSKLKQESKP